MHEHFHCTLTDRESHFRLFLDCAKGFSLLPHYWLTRFLGRAGLPGTYGFALSFNFQASCVFTSSGIVFDCVHFMCGRCQSGPLSGLFFVISCACLFAAFHLQCGVAYVKIFSDDLRSVRYVLNLVRELESVNSPVILRIKSKVCSNRTMSATERRTLDKIWEGA